MRRVTPAVVLALGLLAAACGGGGKDREATLSPGLGSAGQDTTPTAPPPPTTAVPPGPGALITPSGVVVPVVSREDGHWTVTTPCGRTATLSNGTFLPSATIVLDAGHGGSDPGAVSPSGLQEKAVNLVVARHTQTALETAGVTTLLTRTGDYDLNLLTRAQIALAVSPRALVSLHHNAEPDEAWPGPGSETYYQISSSDSKRLAGLIYEEVVKALSRYVVTWVADRDAGVKYRPGSRGDYYAVLRQPAPVVSVLVESAFISNPPEADLLSRRDVQQAEGEAVARGIVRYLTTRDPGSGFVEPYPRPTPPSSGGQGACTDPAL